jgi:NAD(P)-dependent dehydrogenase (short-subunit alcohol dehydrogenase family)
MEPSITADKPRGRVQDKVVIVVGGGQTPGATVGNGRAAAILYAREGARVLVADRDLGSAQDTVDIITSDRGAGHAIQVDVKEEHDLGTMVSACIDLWGKIDVLHYNVGVSSAGGDAPIKDITPEAFTHVMEVNLRGLVLACKHVLPVMRARETGVIISVGSISSRIDFPWVAYKTSKAGVVALTEHVAIRNAEKGVRANVILPGLVDTPMAVEKHVRDGVSRDDVVALRANQVPLKRMSPGNAWDVARAALFLASDEASFITGASLTVDGGQTLVVG